MKKVMVFPCGSEIGLEIHRALRHFSGVELVGASSTDDHGRFVYEHYVANAPHYSEAHFIKAVAKIAKELAIDFIFPAHDGALLKLIEHQASLAPTIVTSPLATCRICRSKRKTYEALKGTIHVPKIYDQSDQLSFPVFLKPEVGQGSKGTYLALDQNDLQFYSAKDPSLMVLEYLPGAEYTVDCFTDQHGNLLIAQARERLRIMNGISVKSRLVTDQRLTEMATSINKALQLHGAWFFQAKENAQGEPVLLEVAPRPASSTGILRLHGLNLIEMTLQERLGNEPVAIKNPVQLEVDRALDTVGAWRDLVFTKIYIRAEGTLIHNNLPNPSVMKLLYNARNLGHHVILVSLEETDFQHLLDQLGIHESLFGETKLLKGLDELLLYLDQESAIYVDSDSCVRATVASRAKVPVFALDTLDTLYT